MSSSPGVPSSVPSRRQKRMGPAPFASFEDLSDELDSPEDKNAAGSVVRLPGIREDITPSTPARPEEPGTQFVYSGISLIGAPCSPTSTAMSTPPDSQSSAKISLQTPSTPRIDISRASSSSHHEDSRDSTPDRELFEGHDPASAKLGLGFREEGTLDLRSSTEELDFQEMQSKPKPKARPQSPCLDSYHSQQRKDSQSSELGLLSISGRTSRLSSIGSQGSAQSRVSNASHLSVISGQSGLSRSPSPHKMLLETSFCGTKPHESARANREKQGTKNEEDMEKVILSRKHDPTKAVLAEGIVVDTRTESPAKTIRAAPEKPARKLERNVQSVKSDITITVDKPPVSSSNIRSKIPKTIVASSGIEYTYIPLKGPLPVDTDDMQAKPKIRESRQSAATAHSKSSHSKTGPSGAKSRTKKVSTTPAITSVQKCDDPQYIRIKLKPDHMYDESLAANAEIQKPDSLNLNDTNKKPAQSFAQIIEKEYHIIEPVVTRAIESQGRSISSTPSASPKPPRHQMLKETITSSKSPSPSLSRRSSFASLFKSKEAIMSPDSPTVQGHKRKNTLTGILRDASDNMRERRRSRSKSRERDRTPTTSVGPSSTESIDSKGRQKSVFSIFKGKKPNEKSKEETSSSEVPPSIEGIEFKFKPENNMPNKANKYYEPPLDGDSIRIPLHSPTYYDGRNILQEHRTSSQDSQETVIEAAPKNVDAIIETVPKTPEATRTVHSSKDEFSHRQSSTSSENVIFSTKLGSNNDIFTTKLPKEKHSNATENHCQIGQSDVQIETQLNIRPLEREVAPFDKTTPDNKTPDFHAEQAQKSKIVKESNPNTLKKELSFASLRKDKEVSLSFAKAEVCTREKEITAGVLKREISPIDLKKEVSPAVLKKEVSAAILKREESLKKEFSSPSFKKEISSNSLKREVSAASIKKEISSPSLKKDISTSSAKKDTAPAETSMAEVTSLKIDNIQKGRTKDHSVAEDEHNSSESERDSEFEFLRNKRKDKDVKKENSEDSVEPERKGLVFQDSFEDELPYIPTTLPLERSVAMPIVPVKQRGNIEMKMYPIERPRSTTPIIPSSLEDYCEEITGLLHTDHSSKNLEKLKISLPREECDKPSKAKSPRKVGNANWFEFAEKGITSQRQTPVSHEAEPIPPPPLPPKGVQKEWINFEEIPERRKPPKRIQTIPSRGTIEVPDSVLQENIVYSYVNPEDCKCECHEMNTKEREKKTEQPEEDELPLLEDEPTDEDKLTKNVERIKLDVTILDRKSIVSDSSIDLSASVEHSEANGIDQTLQTPFTSDLGVSSNRSSIISQDEPQSPESGSPNAFLKS